MEAKAKRFGYTFEGIANLFNSDNLKFDSDYKIHPFAQLPWAQKGCALLHPDSVGCQRAAAMDTFENPVVFKNGVLVASPKLLSISQEKVGEPEG